MRLLAGNSNTTLAQGIADYLDVPLTRAQVRRFADQEIFVTIAENVRGEAVFVVDADNVLMPRAVARLEAALAASGAAGAYSQLVFFGAGEGIGAADVWDPQRFRRDNYVDAMALVRRSAWRAVGGYARLEYGWEDYDLWCKFVEAGLAGVFVPELLCRYRVHAASMLRTDTAVQRRALVEAMMARHPWLDLKM